MLEEVKIAQDAGAARITKLIAALVLSIAATGLGCGSPPSQHSIELVFPSYDCSQVQPPCIPYAGCYVLGISWIYVEVGPEHAEDTQIGCPSELIGPSAKTKIYYQPGQDVYIIKANYARGSSPVEVSAGPFSEDETQTPWKLSIR